MKVKESEKAGLKLSIQKTKIQSHHFMANRWRNNGNRDRLFLGGSKITTDGDCSHEIKRHLLLGRKAMTNLDSILKSRDITLPTKAHSQSMVFPVVMYRCASWTIKKAEHWRTDEEFWTVVLEKTLESPLDCKEIQPIVKEISPEYSLEGLTLKLKLQYFSHLMQRT